MGATAPIAVSPSSTPVPVPGCGLSFSAVSKHFAGVTALDNVTVEVAAGEALALIGPNGAGKSTMLKIVAGIHRPDGGEVRVDGVRLDRLAPYQIARTGVALAHQIPRPFTALTVRDNVRVGALAFGRHGTQEARDHVDAVLELCDLSAKADVAAQSLRVLDLKRLEVARALATRPRVLLLDEVAAGLVGRELEAAIELIQRLHATGLTVLLVEHIERVVREVVARVVVLDWGQVIATGTPAQVAEDPKVREVYLGTGARTSAPAPRAARAADEILRLEGVTAGYGQMLALRDIDLELGAGEIIAVLGANGAGKSTLSGTISGIMRPRAGQISAFGENITRRPSHERARLGIAHCQEGRHVFAGLTVEENLQLALPPLSSRSVLAERLSEVQTLFPVLAERASQNGESLSGGEQQMLTIARALMSKPRILICDEISLGLSPVAVDALYQALADIRDTGVAIVLIEQNVRRALELADRAYVLARGVVTYAGATEPLFDERTIDDAYFGAAGPSVTVTEER